MISPDLHQLVLQTVRREQTGEYKCQVNRLDLYSEGCLANWELKQIKPIGNGIQCKDNHISQDVI